LLSPGEVSLKKIRFPLDNGWIYHPSMQSVKKRRKLRSEWNSATFDGRCRGDIRESRFTTQACPDPRFGARCTRAFARVGTRVNIMSGYIRISVNRTAVKYGRCASRI
jgi:hypothetical protein